MANSLNDEQKYAVKQIMRLDSVPFLLNGPPGTGKTRTLVAAINEILHTSTRDILICAQSDSACDEIAQRLVDIIQPGVLFRMYAKSYRGLIPDKIKPYSNLVGEEFMFPSINYIYRYRVVICTLLTAGCITRSRIDNNFQSAYFEYTIIDDATCAPEIVTMIPIAGMHIFLFIYHYFHSPLVVASTNL